MINLGHNTFCHIRKGSSKKPSQGKSKLPAKPMTNLDSNTPVASELERKDEAKPSQA